MGGIAEHVGAEIGGGIRAMNLAGETFSLDSWEVTTMVEVRVGKHNRLNLFDRIARMAIAAVGGFARPLEEATFEEKFVTPNFKQVL
jgi:hypothetical protein